MKRNQPSHVVLSPGGFINPLSQVHSKLPILFSQTPLLQTSAFLHSSISWKNSVSVYLR